MHASTRVILPSLSWLSDSRKIPSASPEDLAFQGGHVQTPWLKKMGLFLTSSHPTYEHTALLSWSGLRHEETRRFSCGLALHAGACYSRKDASCPAGKGALARSPEFRAPGRWNSSVGAL
jgi:hypothetical protein